MAFKQVLISVVYFVLLVGLVLASPQDLDEDGVLNEQDVCEETTIGATIVNPSANVDYAGCSCQQIEEQFELSKECMYCYGTVLTIQDSTYRGMVVPCQEQSYCEGNTFYEYKDISYSRCEEGILVQSSCGPFIEENSARCPRTPEEDRFQAIPELEGRKVQVGATDLTFVIPEIAVQGEEISITVLSVFDIDSFLNLEVQTAEGRYELDASNGGCADASADTRWCIGHVTMKFNNPGTQEITMFFEGNSGELDFTIDILGNPVLLPSIITGKEGELEFIAGIYEDIIEEGYVENYVLEEELQAMAFAQEQLIIEKEREGKKRILSVEARDKTVRDVRVIEHIPKSLAEHVDEIQFTTEPHIIVKEDPLIMWHFEEVEERVDLSYDVEREVEVTGNTIVTAQEVIERSTEWDLIIPVILIPIVVMFLVILPRHFRKHHE